MAVIIATHKMTVRTDEGEITIFPSPDRQSLPDKLLEHEHIQGAITSGWITVIPVAEEKANTPESEATPTSRKKKVS